MNRHIPVIASLCAICGCFSINTDPSAPVATDSMPKGSARYALNGEVDSGKASELTIYDLDEATQSLLAKMRKNALFTQNYTRVRDAKGALPVIVVGNIENKTNSRIQNRLDLVREIVTTSLFENDLFEVKDDNAAAAIVNRIAQSAEGGLEDGALVAAYGSHDSPDFMLLGELSSFRDTGGIHTYKLKFAIHNLQTGKLVWQGMQTNIKL